MADRCKLSAAIVSGSVERSYLLKVDGFKGHDWVLRYYPNGGRSEIGDSARYVSLVVECCDAIDDLPKPHIDLRDRDGQPEPPYVVSTIYSCPGYPMSAGLTSYYLFLIDKAELEQSGDIIDDCFSIRCVLTLSEETMDDRFVVVPPSNLHLHFADLLESMDGADVTFHIGGQMFSVHRLILAARSPVFRAELLGAMKLCSHIDANMAATSLVLAEQHCCNGLKEACLQFLASPSNLEAMMASDGYKHLKSSCPSALKELIARLLPPYMKAAKDIVMAL
ncbi:BTB/POZ and MATH domain-containing protein 3-like [Triticum aestivum]|uniref:BTB/POZ and MATH domain-containing protein 3-like n=1 Tax=Triticum aestivum TaxID=4565 RepID=UPI001D01693F|nr:BTB/POZ and MATH domain-containing protein 3-like [Triticum aestivum]